MKHLKTYSIFESADVDYEGMGRLEFFGISAQIGFNFSSRTIVEPSEIEYLIKYYNETYLRNDEWNGGPVNKEFRDFFSKKYNTVVHGSDFKPGILLLLNSKFGTHTLGFSIKSKECISFGVGDSLTDDDNLSEYDEGLLNQIHEELWKFYNNRSKMQDVIDYFDINITNMVDWNWIEKEEFNQ